MTTQPSASFQYDSSLLYRCLLYFASRVFISYYLSYLDFIHCLSPLLLNYNMNSRGTKLVFLELEKVARWITTLALLIWGSEPPALTKRAWHKCSCLWLQYCAVETGRSWTLPGQPALPKAVSFWFSKGPCLKAKRWRWQRKTPSVLFWPWHVQARCTQTHLYAEYSHACTWTHTQTQFIRNCLYVHCSACGIWLLVCYRVNT